MDESETEKFAGQFLETLLEEVTLFISWFSTKYLICFILLGLFFCAGAGGVSEDKVLFTRQDHLYQQCFSRKSTVCHLEVYSTISSHGTLYLQDRK